MYTQAISTSILEILSRHSCRLNKVLKKCSGGTALLFFTWHCEFSFVHFVVIKSVHDLQLATLNFAWIVPENVFKSTHPNYFSFLLFRQQERIF